MRNSLFISLVIFTSLLLRAANAQTRVDLNPSDARLSGPFILTNGYIAQTIHSAHTNGGRAVFKFVVPIAGDYAIRARVEPAPTQAGSFFVNVDGEPRDPETLWEIPSGTGPADLLVTVNDGKPGTIARQKVFKLSAGTHELCIAGRSAHTKLSTVSILQVPPPPTGLHVVNQH